MVSATVREVMDDALTIIGEVAGTGVQTYSEDRVMRDTIRAFNLLFKKHHWDQYACWLHLELDGTTGVIKTDSLEGVKDFEDFISVNPANKDFGLPILPKSINPFRLTTGTDPLYWTSLHATNAKFRKRKIIVYPVTATGFIDVHVMLYPITSQDNDWAESTRMEFDRDMLAYGTAFMTLAADDLNPQAAGVAQNMMEMRFRDIINKLSSHKIPIDSRTGVPTNWTVAP
jgi:hypothetical protein